MSQMTEEDIKVLEQQSDKMLAIWHCLLNTWRWPKRHLSNPKSFDYYRTGGRRSEIMHWIINKIGEKYANRLWNFNMTDEEHNIWWDYMTTPYTKETESKHEWNAIRDSVYNHPRTRDFLDLYEELSLEEYNEKLLQDMSASEGVTCTFNLKSNVQNAILPTTNLFLIDAIAEHDVNPADTKTKKSTRT